MEKKAIIITLGIVALVVAIIFSINSSKAEQDISLEEFCKPDENFKNIYSLGDREFLALSIADKVDKKLQLESTTKRVKPISEILESPSGDCDEHSLMLSECLSLYGFENELVYTYFENTTDHHSFVIVQVNGASRILDSSVYEFRRYILYTLGVPGFDFWDYTTWKGVLNESLFEDTLGGGYNIYVG